MFSQKNLIVGLLALAYLTGCQPARSQRDSGRSIGRAARGTGTGRVQAPGSGEWTTGGKTYGRVTSSAGDQAFNEELFGLTYPALASVPEAQKLGYVSSQDNQSTGVAFFGSASNSGGGINGMTYGSSSFDSNSVLQLEIYDDRAVQSAQSGGDIQPIIIRIARDQPTFVDAGGSISGSQVNLYFQDIYSVIYLDGQINGQYFSGTIAYANGPVTSGNNARTLGTFTIPTCSFFNCN